MRINSLLESAAKYANKHEPAILTGIGIVGMGVTVILAVHATPKALTLIEEEKKKEEVEELSIGETVRTTWRCFVPAAATAMVSIICLLWSNAESSRRNAALMTAYTFYETTLKDYREETEKVAGKKKEREISDAVALRQIERNPVRNNEIIPVKSGTTICYDAFGGRYFYSDAEHIRRAIDVLNRRMQEEDPCISLNEYYNELDLRDTDVGDMLEWDYNATGFIIPEFTYGPTEDGTPCLIVGFRNPPRYR